MDGAFWCTGRASPALCHGMGLGGGPRHPGGEVVEAPVERLELPVVRLGDVDPEALDERSDEPDEVERVQVEILAQAGPGRDFHRIDLGGELDQLLQHRPAKLVARHRASGFWSRESSSERNSPPRWPSLTRWSADSVAVRLCRGTHRPSMTHGTSTTLPNPTSATWGGKMIPNTS